MDYCDDTNELSSQYASTDAVVVSYIQVRVLGKGAHGKAVLYRNAIDNSLAVWKEISINENKKNEIQREIDILSILDHPNIVAYYNHFVNLNTVFIEMEYANNGSLSNYLRQVTNDLPDSEVLWYFFQLLYALEYIHKLQIIHRDIKTLNIFMTSSTLIKIGDFGISKVLQDDEFAKTQVGTPVYMSPEVIQGLLYSSKSDIWACGCVLYELITRRKLFEYSNQLSLAMKIVNREFQKMPQCKNSHLLDLLQNILIHDPEHRLSATECLKHQVWKGNQQNMIEQIQRIHQMNVIHRPCSGDRKEREIVSLNSEVFVWGGGKAYPIKLDQFKETDCAIQVSTGMCHFAVLTIEKDVYTWSNVQGDIKLTGQLGHRENIYKKPKLVSDLKGMVIKMVSCGADSTICLSCNGEMFGCGSNYYGQLGIGSIEPETINYFVKIPIKDFRDGSLIMVNQINCGYYHAAAIAGDEDFLYTWGCGEYGRLGLGTEDNVYQPTLVDISLHKCKLRMVHCGYDSTFLVHQCSGRLMACGNNEFNKLGINITAKGLSGSSQEHFSYDVPFETKFKLSGSLRNMKVSTISCGKNHTVILDVYNKLYLFGDNTYGQLGLGDTKKHSGICKGSKILAGKDIERISCGDYFTIVSTKNNEIFGWGLADNGRLGLESSSDQKCVLYPRPLFGALQKCANIQSFGWQTITITERVIETNTISANSSSIIPDTFSSHQNDSVPYDNEYTGTKSSKMQTWLQAELDKAEVIYMDEASMNSYSNDLTTNLDENYSCDCGCQKCSKQIQKLTQQLSEYKK